MSRADDQTYYSRRTADELKRGDEAIDATIAAIHYELAKRYSILAARSRSGTPKLFLVDCVNKQPGPTESGWANERPEPILSHQGC